MKIEVQKYENFILLVEPKYFLFPINDQRKDNGWNSQQSTSDKKIMKSKIFNYKSRASGNKPWGEWQPIQRAERTELRYMFLIPF